MKDDFDSRYQTVLRTSHKENPGYDPERERLHKAVIDAEPSPLTPIKDMFLGSPEARRRAKESREFDIRTAKGALMAYLGGGTPRDPGGAPLITPPPTEPLIPGTRQVDAASPGYVNNFATALPASIKGPVAPAPAPAPSPAPAPAAVATPAPAAPAPATSPLLPVAPVADAPAPTVPQIPGTRQVNAASPGYVESFAATVPTAPAPAPVAEQAPPPPPAVPQPTDPNATMGGGYESTFVAADGNTYGIMPGENISAAFRRVREGQATPLTAEQIRETGLRNATTPTISGEPTNTTTRAIDPASGDLVYADQRTANSLNAAEGRRIAEEKAAQQEAIGRFNTLGGTDAAIDRAIAQERQIQEERDWYQGRLSKRIEANSGPRGGSSSGDGYFGSDKYYRDLSGRNGADNKAKAEAAKLQDQRDYADGVRDEQNAITDRRINEDREYRDDVRGKTWEREDGILDDRQKHQMDVLEAQHSNRMEQLTLEGENYGKNIKLRTEEQIRYAENKARIALEAFDDKMARTADPKTRERMEAVVAQRQGAVNAARSELDAAVQIPAKVEQGIRNQIAANPLVQENESLYQQEYDRLVKEYRNTSEYKTRVGAAELKFNSSLKHFFKLQDELFDAYPTENFNDEGAGRFASPSTNIDYGV